MLPIGDFNQRPLAKRPIVLWIIIGLCLAVWLYQVALPDASTAQTPSVSDLFIYEYGAIPGEITGQENRISPIHPLLTLLTAIFLHGSWSHVIFNMLYLWVFGDNIESTFGHFGFLMFYLIGGVFANLAHVAFSWGSAVPVVGASGAIAAVMGAYLALYPNSRIMTLIFYFPVVLPAYYYLLFWLGMQFFNVLGGSIGVAWWAHIGGFLFGYLVAIIFIKIKKPGAPMPWNVFFSKAGRRRKSNPTNRYTSRLGSNQGFSDEGNGDGRADNDYDIWRR